VRNRWRGLLISEWDNTREFADHFSFTMKTNRPPAARLGGFLFQGFLRKINIHYKENTSNDNHTSAIECIECS
jgi:hypothetical protein